MFDYALLTLGSRGEWLLGTRVTDSCVLLCGCWEFSAHVCRLNPMAPVAAFQQNKYRSSLMPVLGFFIKAIHIF